MTYAHQPGSLPIDVPETEPNPVFVPEDPPHVPAPVPSDPVETPERVPEKVSQFGPVPADGVAEAEQAARKARLSAGFQSVRREDDL